MNNTMLFISIDPIEYRRRVLNEIETAKKAGFHVSVISTSPAALIQNKFDFAYSAIFIPGFLSRGFFRFPIFNILLLFKILFRSFTVIHFRGNIPIPAILFRQVFNKSILIYDAHEYFKGHQVLQNRPLRKAIWLWFEERISSHLEHLVTVSEQLGEMLRKDYPRIKNIEIIRSLPQLQPDQNQTITESGTRDRKTILFHGYFHLGRALENIIIAFSKIQDKSIQLLLIGEGPLEQKLNGLVGSLGLESSVQFMGIIPNDQLIQYISRADVGLSIIQADCLNRKFALPNKFFEYIHAGLPVLSSNIPTLQAYTDQYGIGLTVDPEDPEAIAGSITAMVSDPVQLRKWKANCTAAAKELNWQKESEKLLKIYQKLLQ